MPAIDPMVDLSYDRDEGGSWRIRAKITHVTEKKKTTLRNDQIMTSSIRLSTKAIPWLRYTTFFFITSTARRLVQSPCLLVRSETLFFFCCAGGRQT